MDGNDQNAIKDLFGKLGEVERNAPQHDAEAESFIGRQIAEQPGAPYYMAQTIIVQEQALQAAQARIEELEAGAAQGNQDGGFLGALFGGGAPTRTARPMAGQGARRGQMGGMNTGGMGSGAGRQGGGFLAGAAQTAAGVAGGLLIGNMLGGMFGGVAEAADQGMENLGEATGLDAAGDFDDMEF